MLTLCLFISHGVLDRLIRQCESSHFIIEKEQFGFVKIEILARILDRLLPLYGLQKSKKLNILFKINFGKAFDHVE